jgi:hypothetical protein
MMHRTRDSHRRWMTGVLACALLTVTATSCADDEPDASDDPSDEVTVPPSAAATPPPVGTAPSQDAVADATAFWEAVVAGDRPTALSYIDPVLVGEEPLLDAEPMSMPGRAYTLERQFDWWEVVGWQWTLQGCSPDDAFPDDVQCAVTAKNDWTEATGVEPVDGTFIHQFDDDGYITIVSDSFMDQWLARGWEPFRDWVEENHPDDLEVMLADGQVNTEILELYRINTERYVDAQRGA